MLKDLKCPKCLGSSNLVIFIDFKRRKPEVAICLTTYFKPSLTRKFGTRVLKSNGCGYKFALKGSKMPQVQSEQPKLGLGMDQPPKASL